MREDRDHSRRFRLSRLTQLIEPAFQPEAIFEDERCRAEFHAVGGNRLIFVRIAAGADERGQIDIVTTDDFGPVSDDADRRDDLRFVRTTGSAWTRYVKTQQHSKERQ
jgi:hypothetical protein